MESNWNEWMSGNTHKVNVQDVRIMYPVNKLIKCLPDDNFFGYAAKYHAHLYYIENHVLVVNPNVLPDI